MKKEHTFFQLKDLCMIEHIPENDRCRIDSFKIEWDDEDGSVMWRVFGLQELTARRSMIILEHPKKYEANMPWYRDQISNLYVSSVYDRIFIFWKTG